VSFLLCAAGASVREIRPAQKSITSIILSYLRKYYKVSREIFPFSVRFFSKNGEILKNQKEITKCLQTKSAKPLTFLKYCCIMYGVE
jgi:phage-related protein